MQTNVPSYRKAELRHKQEKHGPFPPIPGEEFEQSFNPLSPEMLRVTGPKGLHPPSLGQISDVVINCEENCLSLIVRRAVITEG